MEVLMEEGSATVTSAPSISRGGGGGTSTAAPSRSSPAPSTVVAVSSSQGRTNGTVVFASPAQVKQLNVVPSSTTQALAVQQPGGGVSIVHVSIPNQQMHVQSVIQPNQQSVIQAAGGAALQTLGKNVILVNKGSVIHSADGDAGVHPVQLIPAGKLDATGQAAMVTGEDEPKKRRELLARRPSYRRILNELSSTEAQGAVASLTEEAKEEQEDDPDGTITVAGTQYHTAAGLLKVVPASAIQLATVTQEGSLQGLQTLTMTNAGSAATAGTIVQYAQGQDGQFFRASDGVCGRPAGLPDSDDGWRGLQPGPDAERGHGPRGEPAEPAVARRRGLAQAGAAPTQEQGRGQGVSSQEEGVHQVSGEQGGRTGEPKQGTHRRAQVPQGALLPEERVKIPGHRVQHRPRFWPRPTRTVHRFLRAGRITRDTTGGIGKTLHIITFFFFF
ncbi:cyclic AMP-dependent transcription factor ATF-1 isoform X2 [Ixodes scapularis]